MSKKSIKPSETSALDSLIVGALVFGQKDEPVSASISQDTLSLADVEAIQRRKAILMAQVTRDEVVEQGASTVPSEKALRNVLRGILETFKFDAGIIYIADYSKHTLTCSAYLDSVEANRAFREFFYSFDDHSFATTVFNEKCGFFSADPANDGSSNVRGLELFKISGPIVGVPLIIGTKPVGALIVWSRTRIQPTEKDIELLRPSACLAAGVIQSLEEDHCHAQRMAVRRTFQRATPIGMSDTFPDDYVLHWLLGVQAAGFERARLFAFDKKETLFICIASLGVLNRWSESRCVISLSVNQYAKHLADNYSVNHRARVYDPSLCFPGGIDPNASLFDKPPDLPWAAVPIIINGELLGQIIADNAVSRLPIANDSLEHLTLLGGLISQAIAKERNSRTIADFEAFYHSLAEGCPRCVIRKDVDGRFLYANTAFCKRLGRPSEEVIGKTDRDLYPLDLANKFINDDKKVMNSGEMLSRVEENESAGGRYYVHVFKAPVWDSRRNIVGVQCVFWDITHERTAAEELQHARRQLAIANEQTQARIVELEKEIRRRKRIEDRLRRVIAFIKALRRGGIGHGIRRLRKFWTLRT